MCPGSCFCPDCFPEGYEIQILRDWIKRALPYLIGLNNVQRSAQIGDPFYTGGADAQVDGLSLLLRECPCKEVKQLSNEEYSGKHWKDLL